MNEQEITMTVNGRRVRLVVEPRKLLVDALRDELGLTGTHVGCEHGVCGTCTILVNGKSVRSCIAFAVQADGADIRTVEGLADGPGLHPLQDEFWEKQGLQCGYCTPGMLMRCVEIIERNPSPTVQEVREQISGNLCRCTGYQYICEAVVAAAERMRGEAKEKESATTAEGTAR
ncbi:(2Fe-2S)-binding protein [Spirillospora sp. CA-255316]